MPTDHLLSLNVLRFFFFKHNSQLIVLIHKIFLVIFFFSFSLMEERKGCHAECTARNKSIFQSLVSRTAVLSWTREYCLSR